MLLGSNTQPKAVASRQWLRADLRQWAAYFLMDFWRLQLIVRLFLAMVFSTSSRCYSALFQSAGQTRQSKRLAYGDPLTFVC